MSNTFVSLGNSHVLTAHELEAISGGDWLDWIDGGCAALGAAGVITGGSIFANPVGGAAGTFCAGWALGRWLA